ncbi:MAG TPA: zinc-ribbon domain-containing protein [Pirellulaceae bacterium]|nr:zinc-ribbon domain-containing protein [Pirellulaceae bacterium]HMO90557.1 zinc-ribbon domain-containing protein [Pirellulaceae bacterium]HMP71224.1 zinc-ribbon domain-containing protein [Pirellulaceae bacterium]
MNKRSISCPKCGAKYQVDLAMDGKKLKCPSCQHVFALNFGKTQQAATSDKRKPVATTTQATSTTRAAVSSTTAASREKYKKYGLDGPLEKEADLFAESGQPTKVVLDNFAADPGFANIDPSRFVFQADDPRKDNPLFANPAFSHAEQLADKVRSGEVGPAEADPNAPKLVEGIGVQAGSITAVLSLVVGIFAIMQVFDMFTIQLIFAGVMTLANIGGLVVFVQLIKRIFAVGETWEGLLSVFVPGFIIYTGIKYWKHVKYEFLQQIIFGVLATLAVIIYLVCLVIMLILDPGLANR